MNQAMFVEDVVQARDDQQPVEQPVDEKSCAPRSDDGAARRVHALLEHGPAITECRREQQAGEPARNRHETPAAEECEVVRQLDVAVAVVERARDEARKDSDRHAELGDFTRFPGGRGQVARRALESGQSVRRYGQQHFGTFGRHEITDDGGEPGRAMVFPRETDRYANRKEHAEVRKDGLPGRRHPGDVQ
jgi:hypothetical protein